MQGVSKDVRRFNLPPPIGLSDKMHNKENITFLALLSLFFFFFFAVTWIPI